MKIDSTLAAVVTGGASGLGLATVQAFYQRLLAKGKEPMVALVACMRNLIIILNTMLARRQKWNPGRHAPA